MNITSRQIYRAVTHYQKTNGVNQAQEETYTESLIEAMRTGEGNHYVTIDKVDGLGTGFHITGHGSYFPTKNEHVFFVTGV
jgi:cysteine synthase